MSPDDKQLGIGRNVPQVEYGEGTNETHHDGQEAPPVETEYGAIEYGSQEIPSPFKDMSGQTDGLENGPGSDRRGT